MRLLPLYVPIRQDKYVMCEVCTECILDGNIAYRAQPIVLAFVWRPRAEPVSQLSEAAMRPTRGQPLDEQLHEGPSCGYQLMS
jgi:hypothetical protein